VDPTDQGLRAVLREKSFGQRLRFGARGGKSVTLGPRTIFLGRPKRRLHLLIIRKSLKKYKELMDKAQSGSLNTAEITYLCSHFNPAELYQYEQAIKLSVSLLKQWLATYKFKNWKITKTRGLPVTPAMRRKRAQEIAIKLSIPDDASDYSYKWYTHGHGISMAVLRSEELKLQIEDFGKDKDLWKQIRDYWSLLTNHMAERGHKGVIHIKKRYKPLKW